MERMPVFFKTYIFYSYNSVVSMRPEQRCAGNLLPQIRMVDILLNLQIAMSDEQ